MKCAFHKWHSSRTCNSASRRISKGSDESRVTAVLAGSADSSGNSVARSAATFLSGSSFSQCGDLGHVSKLPRLKSWAKRLEAESSLTEIVQLQIRGAERQYGRAGRAGGVRGTS